MSSKFLRTARYFFEIVLMGIAPLAFIGFIIALIALPSDWGEHRLFVQRLDESGKVTQGVVTSTSPENDWVFVDYIDDDATGVGDAGSAAGKTRYGVIDMFYYDDETLWHTLTPSTTVSLRYLPWHVPGNDRVVLTEHYAEVRAYRGFISRELIGLLLVCWVLVIIKPHFLYVGLVDADLLFKDALTL